jgi:acetyl-CoA carboxylase biotin carboxylase subunit
VSFLPSPGKIVKWIAPGGKDVRIDTHAFCGYTIQTHYDSMIGKLIVRGRDRTAALNRMSRALSEIMITGVKTTIPFLQTILQDPDFRRGVYSTGFIEQLQQRGNP